MSKKISMQDIADKLGLSKNTISLALRGMPGISDQTRKLIFDTVKEYGYEYKKKPSDFSKAASGNICLILSKSTMKSADFFSYIQFGIENEAKINNLNVFLYCYDEGDDDFETPICIKEGMISGIITLGRISEKNINSIISFGLPVVMVDHYFDRINTDCVLTDNITGGFLATMHLIRCGHTEIGFSGNINASVSFYDRYLGYLKALKTYSLRTENTNMLIEKSMDAIISNGIHEAVNELSSISKMPTAFFCCNDVEAIALYKAFSAMGLSIPGDISIIGFDDTEAAVNVTPELTTMHVEKDWMGRKAVRKLLSKMETDTVAEKLLISSYLIERNSVRKL